MTDSYAAAAQESTASNVAKLTVADADVEMQAIRTVVNAVDAIEAVLGTLDADSVDAVLPYADSRYKRATAEFRPAKTPKADGATPKRGRQPKG